MSEGLGGHVTKGIIHARLDEYLNTHKEQREKFLGGLRKADTAEAYLRLLREMVEVPANEASYLRDTWYNDSEKGLWYELQPIYPILKQGLITALEAAGPDLPLDSYWTPVGTQVEVIVTKSPHQVTRIIVTPPGPPPQQTRKDKVPLWVVRRGKAGQELEKKDQSIEVKEGGILVCQMKEWQPVIPLKAGKRHR